MQSDRNVIEPIELALVVQNVRRETLLDYFQSFSKLFRALCRIGTVKTNLDRRNAPSHSEFKAAAAHLVEHADFFNQAQRMIKREQIYERTEAKSLGTLRDRRQENTGRRRITQWRSMVLG
jgi:hypothetical protein